MMKGSEMRKNINITDEQMHRFLEHFYRYFKTGYAFEEFLKKYLERIGLDEVLVTQRSNDGGIDLEAVRYGVGGLDEADSVKYYVQAKRNKPGSVIPIEKVRALRGVMPSGSKGIFITTAAFSKKTKEFVGEDLTRPIILIDGEKLINSCIEMEIGFVYTPEFSESAMDEFNKPDDNIRESRENPVEEEESNVNADNAIGINADDKRNTNTDSGSNINAAGFIVNKDITANDIRARILRLPRAILEKLPADQKTVDITIDGIGKKRFSLDSSRCYVSGGVTEIYRMNGLIDKDGTYNPRTAVWRYRDGGDIWVHIKD